MARGFHVRLTIHEPEWLTTGHVADVAREQGQWLTEREVLKFIPAAVEAAKALIAGIEHGPFFVNFDGIDNFGVHGQATQVVVSVDSGATKVPDGAPVMNVTSSSTEVNEPTAGPDAGASGPAAPASVEATETPEEEPSDEVVDGEA